MKSLFIYLIRLYQKILSPDTGLIRKAGLIKGPVCGFYPSCSEYFVLSIQKYGVARGTIFFFGRIIKCHPWRKDFFDPVP